MNGFRGIGEMDPLWAPHVQGQMKLYKALVLGDKHNSGTP